MAYVVPCNGKSAQVIKLVQKRKHLHVAEVLVIGGTKSLENLGDLAQGKTCKMNDFKHPNHKAEKATDGIFNKRGSAQSKSPGWLEVNLGKKFPVHVVLVHGLLDKKEESWIHGTEVRLDGNLCGKVHWFPDRNVFPVYCKGREGQVVKLINKNKPLRVSEVQVLGTGNGRPGKEWLGEGGTQFLSFGAGATASSHEGAFRPWNAINLMTQHHVVFRSKKGPNNWLKINLGRTSYINMIVVTNPKHGQHPPNRLQGVEVYVVNKKKQTKVSTIDYHKHHHIYFISANGLQGDTIAFIQPRNDHLQFSEVEVYGGNKAIKGLNVLSRFKPAYSSEPGHTNQPFWAVDGNGYSDQAQQFTANHYSNKKGKGNWIRVELLGVYPIYMVIVRSRHNDQRIDNAIVSSRFTYIFSYDIS